MTRTVPTIADVQYFFTLRKDADVYGKRGIFYALVRLYRCSTLRYGDRCVYKVRAGDYDPSVHARHHGLKIIAI